MNFEDLKSPELQEKLKAAKTAEELAALAKEKGVELGDEELDAISGGTWGDGNDGDSCPWCGMYVKYEGGMNMPKYCPHCNGQLVF